MAHDKCVKKACKNCDCIKDDLNEAQKLKQVVCSLIMLNFAYGTIDKDTAQKLIDDLGVV